MSNIRKSRNKETVLSDVADIAKKKLYPLYENFIVKNKIFSIVLTPVYYKILRPFVIYGNKHDASSFASHKNVPFTIRDVHVTNLDISTGTLYIDIDGFYGNFKKTEPVLSKNRYIVPDERIVESFAIEFALGWDVPTNPERELEQAKNEANRRVTGVFKKLSQNIESEELAEKFSIIKEVKINKIYMYRYFKSWYEDGLTSRYSSDFNVKVPPFTINCEVLHSSSFIHRMYNVASIIKHNDFITDYITKSDADRIFKPVLSYFDFREIEKPGTEKWYLAPIQMTLNMSVRRNITKEAYSSLWSNIYDAHGKIPSWKKGSMEKWVDDEDNVTIYAYGTFVTSYIFDENNKMQDEPYTIRPGEITGELNYPDIVVAHEKPTYYMKPTDTLLFTEREWIREDEVHEFFNFSAYYLSDILIENLRKRSVID